MENNFIKMQLGSSKLLQKNCFSYLKTQSIKIKAGRTNNSKSLLLL